MAFDAASEARRPNASGSSNTSAGGGDSRDSISALKQRVFRLLNCATTIDSLSEQLGTAGDTAQLRQRIRRECEAAAQLVTEIDGGLRRARVAVMAGGNSTTQRDLERLQDDYDNLKIRAVESVKRSQQRQRQFAPSARPSDDEASTRAGPRNGGDALSSSQQVMIEMRNFRAVADVDDAVAQERHEEASAIAKDAVELRDMMRDMSGAVQQQGEMIQQVEDQVDESRAHVVQANQELTLAAEYQKSYRRKLCIAAACCVGLLAVVLIPLLIHFFPSSSGGGAAPAVSPVAAAAPAASAYAAASEPLGQ